MVYENTRDFFFQAQLSRQDGFLFVQETVQMLQLFSTLHEYLYLTPVQRFVLHLNGFRKRESERDREKERERERERESEREQI